MRVVVTGAIGFIGRWLVEELLHQGDDVTIIIRNRAVMPKDWIGKVRIVESSMEKYNELTRKDFDYLVFDLFFHLAWEGVSGEENGILTTQLRNIQTTCDALYLAVRLNCVKFINAGSIMEYEAMQYLSIDKVKPNMRNIYSTAKLAADFMAKTIATQENIMYVNAIISNVYGAGEKSSRFFNTTLRKMQKNEIVKLTKCTQLYDFIYVSDAVRAIIFIGKNGDRNVSYYIGNAKQYPLKYFVLKMKEILESDSELLFGAADFEGIFLSYDNLDTKKLERMGFEVEIAFETGIILTRDWILLNEYHEFARRD